MRGRIVQSSGGTLFLDEIGDMPLALQTRLLRVLEELEVTPLGCETAIKVNLRVMCASHRNLRDMMARGEFREDLFYRLNGITMDLPALADRQDIEILICKCIARESGGKTAASIESIALERLLAYDWPGNIRELRNTIRTALAICDDHVIRLADLPAEIRNSVPSDSLGERAAGARGNADAKSRHGGEGGDGREAAAQVSLASAERQALLLVIEQYRWNMSLVAEHFHISRNTLYRKVKRHGIPLPNR